MNSAAVSPFSTVCACLCVLGPGLCFCVGGCGNSTETRATYMRMVDYPAALRPDRVTVIAYGALLSEPSSRLTFPSLTNFRLVRVRNVRRLFGMTHLFLTGAGVVDVATRRRLRALFFHTRPPSSLTSSAAPQDRRALRGAGGGVLLCRGRV